MSIIEKYKKDLNTIAELAWHEDKTSAYIKTQLGNDVFWSEKNALIYKLGNGDPIFFRAELDALNTPSGVKHVCGHSTHAAALMGAYQYFKKHTPNYTIYFVFQPSEEGYPSGAEYITNHFFKMHPVKAGFAFHVSGSEKKLGKLFDVRMASGDYFEITIKGKSTHIKNKNIYTSSDVLTVAGEIIKKINSKKSKNSIMNVGTIQGGETPNSIAGEAKLTGDVRTNNEKLRAIAKTYIETIIKKIQNKYSDLSISLMYSLAYPVLKNDKKLLEIVKKIIPVDSQIESFGTEDFSFYPKPFVFLHIGTGTKESIHEENFTVPDTVTEAIYRYWIRLGENLRLV